MSDGPILFTIQGIPLLARDQPASSSMLTIAREVHSGIYLPPELELRPGDVVIDIGAHVGIFSIFLAKKHPGIRILAFEPHPGNHANCAANLELNGISSVELFPIGASGDGRDIALAHHPANTGGASCLKPSLQRYGVCEKVPTMRLDEIFERYVPDRCRLLKLDCEGMEYEILYDFKHFSRLDFLSGEIHRSSFLQQRFGTPRQLLMHCERKLGADRLSIVLCDVAA